MVRLFMSLLRRFRTLDFHRVLPNPALESLSTPKFFTSSCCNLLMTNMVSLGHHRLVLPNCEISLTIPSEVTQGGDWGYIITRLIGAEYPSHCLASHLNFIRTNAPTLAKHPIFYFQSLLTPYTAKEKAGLARTNWFRKESYGCGFEQSTKPSTIGFALNDSPVALLAWIYEKLHDWTDNYPWTDDEILTWVSDTNSRLRARPQCPHLLRGGPLEPGRNSASHSNTIRK